MNLLYVRWDVNPFIFSIGNYHFRWYTLFFLIIFIAGLYAFRRFCKREKMDVAFLDPLFQTVLLATIIGARIGHCLFYDPGYYFGSWEGFLHFFMVWEGGLASHGGACGLLLAIGWFSVHYKDKYHVDFLWIMDHLCIVTAFAGGLIRLGNLINSEIYGNVTTLPWGFIFVRAGETLPRHPTQIYEALCYFILGIVLLWMYRHRAAKVYRGFLMGLFLLVCFVSRFLIEFIKEPQVEFERANLLNQGQLLSIPFILAGIVLLILSYRWKKPSAGYLPKS